MKPITKLCIGSLVLIALSPLGLILPARFGAGSAWGEWSPDEVHRMVGYTPSGMAKDGRIWKAPMPDYALKGQEKAPLRVLSVSYIVTGLVGAAVVGGLAMLIGRALARREDNESS